MNFVEFLYCLGRVRLDRLGQGLRPAFARQNERRGYCLAGKGWPVNSRILIFMLAWRMGNLFSPTENARKTKFLAGFGS